MHGSRIQHLSQLIYKKQSYKQGSGFEVLEKNRQSTRKVKTMNEKGGNRKTAEAATHFDSLSMCVYV